MKYLEEEKFKSDWEVHQKIENLAIDALKKGLSVEEAQQLVLRSNEYNEWQSIERCFGTEYTIQSYYRDLAGAVEFEKYENKVKQISRLVMSEVTIDETINYSWEYEYDRLFNQIGVMITPVELGIQIGKFSQRLNLTEPIGVLQFLGLITNNPSHLLQLELEDVMILKDKEKEILLYLEEFQKNYIKR
jgi:hypothetical protein